MSVLILDILVTMAEDLVTILQGEQNDGFSHGVISNSV